MGKKKKASAAAATGTSLSKEIHDLKTLNSKLVKEVTELRKQIEHLADRDITDSIERDVFSLSLSSTLREAEARSKAQIAEAAYKAESATAELNAMEMRLLSLLREHDELERELELIIEGSGYSEKAESEKTNWIFYPIAVTAIFFLSTAVLRFYQSSKLKKLKKLKK
ncbi:hypothetical protein KFK09_001280 [Dendrobium nobile]|uniref:Uncharacterized protein n=1 Tax=Dendrobium nobile TaxID=94219 RepID=A0A8T3C716_DENNO|nr:hypothetical protein KFK09_001280 [Dendrobium nobile]